MDNELLELSAQLGMLLKTRHQKIATAESCTGGGIAKQLTEIPGSSLWFDRGFVTYSNESKQQMLLVKPNTLETYGAVSEETALEMLMGALEKSDADCAIAVTGVAGPDGGTVEKPPGTVFIAWGVKNKPLNVSRQNFSGDRWQVREQTIITALKLLVQDLLNT
jgi:nicotinamide-nucleotide amidase